MPYRIGSGVAEEEKAREREEWSRRANRLEPKMVAILISSRAVLA